MIKIENLFHETEVKTPFDLATIARRIKWAQYHEHTRDYHGDGKTASDWWRSVKTRLCGVDGCSCSDHIRINGGKL